MLPAMLPPSCRSKNGMHFPHPRWSGPRRRTPPAMSTALSRAPPAICDVYGFDETRVVVAHSPKTTAELDKNNDSSVTLYARRRSVSIGGRVAPLGLLPERPSTAIGGGPALTVAPALAIRVILFVGRSPFALGAAGELGGHQTAAIHLNVLVMSWRHSLSSGRNVSAVDGAGG